MGKVKEDVKKKVIEETEKIIKATLADKYIKAEQLLDDLRDFVGNDEIADSLGNFLIDRAIVEAEKNNLEKAEEFLKKAQEIDPLNANVHLNLGRLYGIIFYRDISVEELWEDKTDEELIGELAIDAFNKALDIDPDNLDAWNFLASLYMQREMPSKAIEALRESLRIDPEQASKQVELEELLQEYGEYTNNYNMDDEE